MASRLLYYVMQAEQKFFMSTLHAVRTYWYQLVVIDFSQKNAGLSSQTTLQDFAKVWIWCCTCISNARWQALEPSLDRVFKKAIKTLRVKSVMWRHPLKWICVRERKKERIAHTSCSVGSIVSVLSRHFSHILRKSRQNFPYWLHQHWIIRCWNLLILVALALALLKDHKSPQLFLDFRVTTTWPWATWIYKVQGCPWKKRLQLWFNSQTLGHKQSMEQSLLGL